MNVTGTISVTNTPRKHIKSIRTKAAFFKESFIYKVQDGCLVFRKPTLGYIGKLHTPQCNNTTCYFQIVCDDLPIGTFEFDEESTEDCVMIYYK